MDTARSNNTGIERHARLFTDEIYTKNRGPMHTEHVYASDKFDDIHSEMINAVHIIVKFTESR